MNTQNLEQKLISFVTKLAGWLAPLPTAWTVYAHGSGILDWPWFVAAGAALALEALGMATTSIALDFWNYNQSKRKADPKAPLTYTVILVTVYFLAAILLAVVIDVKPEISPVAPALFPVLSMTGVATLALRSGHVRRLEEIENDRAEQRQRRQEARHRRDIEAAELRRIESEARLKEIEASQRAAELAAEKDRRESEERQRLADLSHTLDNLGQTTKGVLAVLTDNPGATHSEIAQALGVTKQTASYHVGRLGDLGLIDRSNGNVRVVAK
jgi:DNA-binding transcriptional ArsR family regulator